MNSGVVALPPPAKKVVVYRNGDPFFHGRKFVVSQRRFLTFEAFLNEVTNRIQAPVAVRNIYTPQHGHRVVDVGELENGHNYVAGGFERFKRLNYLNPEMKQLNEKWKKDGVKNYAGISQKTQASASWRRRGNLPCIIHIFRNGDLVSPPFRTVFSNTSLQDWNGILKFVSEKAQLRTGSVRKLCKLNGDVVSSGEDLVSGDYYVAVGLEKYKNLPYFELLVPPKIVHQPLRNLSNNRRWNPNQGFGKPHLTAQGSTDSALLESSQQVNLRRVQSTGAAQTENGLSSLAVIHKQARKNALKEKNASIFHAKPVQVKQTLKHASCKDEDSVYKMKGPRKETAGAQEIGEDEDTQVDLPLDQKAAETVEEEFTTKARVPGPRKKKVEDRDKLLKAHRFGYLADDSGEAATQKAHFHPARSTAGK